MKCCQVCISVSPQLFLFHPPRLPSPSHLASGSIHKPKSKKDQSIIKVSKFHLKLHYQSAEGDVVKRQGTEEYVVVSASRGSGD